MLKSSNSADIESHSHTRARSCCCLHTSTCSQVAALNSMPLATTMIARIRLLPKTNNIAPRDQVWELYSDVWVDTNANAAPEIGGVSDDAPPRSYPRRRPQTHSFGDKRSEELERANPEVIVSSMVLPGQAEADEAEGPAPGSAEREVAGHMIVVQFFVVLARVNDLPRALAPVV